MWLLMSNSFIHDYYFSIVWRGKNSYFSTILKNNFEHIFKKKIWNYIYNSAIIANSGLYGFVNIYSKEIC